MRINLTDNNIGEPNARTYQGKDIAALFQIADKAISKLCKENGGLLVFPEQIESSNDRIGSSCILRIQNTDNHERVRITTGNVMGFFGIGNLQIKIKSRFDEGRDDYLLHYMLQRMFLN